MSAKEQQEEEIVALNAIYECDEAFKQVNDTTYQYKFGEEDTNKTFLIEIVWTEEYPNEVPNINLDTFYNRNLVQSVKDAIRSVLEQEAQHWLGCAMTYSLIECLRDRVDELTVEQPDSTVKSVQELTEEVEKLQASSSKPAKKEQLTKAQKRRQWERTDHRGEHPRGYNWVDIIRHLSQTGGKSQEDPPKS
ncbi:RWD domain-containing protein [Sergentomyia squamirostris]